MITYTENYNLTLPEESDYYDVSAFNENFETLDAVTAEVEQGITSIDEKIGTPNDTNVETLFSKLNQIETNTSESVSFIKSIQHHTYTVPSSTASGTIEISTVDASRCIVLLERLKYNSSLPNNLITYTLNNNSLTINHINSSSSPSIIFGFWIIEFY